MIGIPYTPLIYHTILTCYIYTHIVYYMKGVGGEGGGGRNVELNSGFGDGIHSHKNGLNKFSFGVENKHLK